MELKLKSIRREIILFVMAGLLLFTGLDKIEVNIMEARNFISAREMVVNNEFLLTTLNNEPRYQKPPLPTWLTALSGSLFGFDSLYGMRLPVVAMTFLLLFVFYYFSKLIGLNSEHSFNNSLILITSFYIFFGGRDNQWDMYTHSFMMVCLFFIWKLFNEDSHQVRNSVLSGIFLSLSFLSKGPVSLYVLMLPFIVSYAIVYHFSFRKKVLPLLNVFVVGLAIGLSWYIYVFIKDPVNFRIITGRETSNWTNYELKPFYYYWNFFIQSGLWTIPSVTALIYPYLKNRVKNIKEYRFAVLWTLLSVLFLSCVPEKKARYLLPVLIPLALTLGFYIEYLIKEFSKSMGRKETIWTIFNFGIITLVGLLYPFILFYLFRDRIKDYLLLLIPSTLIMYFLSYLIIKGFMEWDFRKIFYPSVSIFITIVISIIPMRSHLFTNPGFAPARKAQSIEKQYNIKTYGISEIAPEIIWNFGKPVIMLQKKDDHLVLPPEKIFGLVAAKGDSAIIRNLSVNFNIKKKYLIDMNYDRKDKDRLKKDYYILTRY